MTRRRLALAALRLTRRPEASLVREDYFMKFAAFASCLLLSLLPVHGAGRPNILLILGDDIGFSDLGCCGGEISTPNLDALAANGLRFTQFYNTSRCCPTRAALLTGLYPHQAGVGHMMVDRGFPGYRSNLNRECVTLAEVLRAGGYRTYMCGKWHVTNRDGPKDDNSNWPVQRGFEKFYGTIRGYGNFFDPSSLCRQNTFITPENDPEYKPKVFYYTDALSDNAVRFLQQHQQESAGQAILHVCRLYRRALADAGPGERHRQVPGQVRRRLRAASQSAPGAAQEAGADQPRVGMRAHRRRLGRCETEGLGGPVHGSLCSDD